MHIDDITVHIVFPLRPFTNQGLQTFVQDTGEASLYTTSTRRFSIVVIHKTFDLASDKRSGPFHQRDSSNNITFCLRQAAHALTFRDIWIWEGESCCGACGGDIEVALVALREPYIP